MRSCTLLLVLALALTAQAAQVVVFGDSWGSFSEDEFQQMFWTRGYRNVIVDNQAIGGTTAAFWARLPNSLANAVAENPDCEWVWLSIGGNDGIYGLQLGLPIEEIIDQAINDTRTILDPLASRFPNVKVVAFGYDVVNFDMSVTCRSLGRDLFPECDGDIACGNQVMYNLQWSVEEIATYYKTTTAVNLLGTLQQASREVPPPFPNDNYYTPGDLMRDCIHPNSEGFTFLFDKFWDVYFKAEIEGRYGKL